MVIIKEEDVIPADLYNQSAGGSVAVTLRSRAADSDHIPRVIIRERDDDKTDNAR